LKEIGDPLKRQIKYIVVTVFLMDVMVDMKQKMNHVEMVIMDHYVDHVNTVIFKKIVLLNLHNYSISKALFFFPFLDYFIYDLGFFSSDKKCLQCSKNTYTLTAIVMLGFSIILGKEKFQLYNDDEDDD